MLCIIFAIILLPKPYKPEIITDNGRSGYHGFNMILGWGHISIS